jgi:hypothetical protein
MVMINKLLIVLRDRLESVLQASQYQPDENWVVLANPIEPDGSPTEGISNKLVMFVVSLQHDPSTGTFANPKIGTNDTYPINAPPLVIDAFFLLTANFTGKNYPAGLEMMSRAISFFQSNPVFTHSDSPELPEDVDRMMVEFVSLDFGQANNLLMLTGLKCFPFLLYRIRRLAFSGPAILGVSPPVRSVDQPVDPADERRREQDAAKRAAAAASGGA